MILNDNFTVKSRIFDRAAWDSTYFLSDLHPGSPLRFFLNQINHFFMYALLFDNINFVIYLVKNGILGTVLQVP